MAAPTNWTAVGGTVDQVSDWAFTGFNSAKLIPAGGVPLVYAHSEMVPVLPEKSYTMSGWLRSTVGYPTAGVGVIWYDTGLNQISIITPNFSALVANVNKSYEEIQVSPGNAAFARVLFGESGTPTAGQFVYGDLVMISPSVDPGDAPDKIVKQYMAAFSEKTAVVVR